MGEGLYMPLFIYKLWNIHITQQGESQGERESSTCCYIISLTKLELFTHMYLFPISVWFGACVHLEIWGQVCLLLKGSPSHTSDLPQSDAVFLIDFTTFACWLLSSQWPLKVDCHASSYTLAIVQNFPLLLLIWHHSGSTQILTFDFTSHWPTWRQPLVFKVSSCPC